MRRVAMEYSPNCAIPYAIHVSCGIGYGLARNIDTAISIQPEIQNRMKSRRR